MASVKYVKIQGWIPRTGAHYQMGARDMKNIHLRDVLKAADESYPDGDTAHFYDPETLEGRPDEQFGDGLAQFVVFEILSLAGHHRDDPEGLGYDEVELVAQALFKAADELSDVAVKIAGLIPKEYYLEA